MPLVWKLVANRCVPVLELGETTLDEISLRLPQGVYTTFRTFQAHSRVLGLGEHMQRLQDSAKGAGWPEEIDTAVIRRGLRSVLARWPAGECRVRITVDLSLDPGTVYLALVPFDEPPAWIYSQGVHVRISQSRREVPDVKSTGYIRRTQELKAQLDQDVFEWLIVNRGVILEGITSNFFGVQDGKLVTADSMILRGITRQAVLHLANAQGIAVVFLPVELSGLNDLHEAFITSSSRGVVPVVKIGDRIIGGGIPGIITRQLLTAYPVYVRSTAEMI